jgi:type II secretory pathway pseudopilin PulG
VLWPATADDTRIIVRANPLHPDVQKASAEAMGEINRAVAAAERRAQAAYDRALEQLRKGGKTGELEPVTLDDEGVAGQRIDAELEVIIELAAAASFEIESGEGPTITPGANAGIWVVSVPANTYRSGDAKERREQFRAAESRLFFGLPSRPETSRPGGGARYRVTIPQSATAFCVVIRGNAGLVAELTANADWTQLAAR